MDTKASMRTVGRVSENLINLWRRMTEVDLELLEVGNQLSNASDVEQKMVKAQRSLVPIQVEKKRLTELMDKSKSTKLELQTRRDTIFKSIPSNWKDFLVPGLDTPLNKPHSRFVTKYVPLNIVLQSMQEPVRRLYLQRQLINVRQLLGSLQAQIEQQKVKTNHSEFTANELDEELHRLRRRRLIQEEAAEMDENADEGEGKKEKEEKKVAAVTTMDILDAQTKYDNAKKVKWSARDQLKALKKEFNDRRLDAISHLRTAVSPVLPKYDQMGTIYLWWTFGKATLVSKSGPTEGDSFSDFWSKFGMIMAFGQLLAIVIRQETSYETLYPLPESVLLSSELKDAPMTDAVLERIVKLPNEAIYANLWDSLSRTIFHPNGGTTTCFTHNPKLPQFSFVVPTSSWGSWKWAKKENLPHGFPNSNSSNKIGTATLELQNLETTLWVPGLLPAEMTSMDGVLKLWKENYRSISATTIFYSTDGFDAQSIAWNSTFLRLPPLAQPIDLFSLAPAESVNKETTCSQAWQASGLGSRAFSLHSVIENRTDYISWLKVWLVTATAWLPTSTYKTGDLVSFQGKTYLAIAPSVSNPETPARSNLWKLRLPAPNEFEDVPCLFTVDDENSSPAGIHATVVHPRWSTKPGWSCLNFSAYPPRASKPNKLQESQAQSVSEFKALLFSALPTAASVSPDRSYWRAETHYINATGGCELLLTRPGITSKGAVFVNVSKQLANVFNVDFMLLEDAAFNTCPGSSQWISLRIVNTMKEGLPWYSRFGFIPIGQSVAIKFITNVLSRLPWLQLRAAMLAVIPKESNTMIQSIEAMTCATAPISCIAGSGSCISSTPLRETVEVAGRRICTNFSAFLQFFKEVDNVDALLKQLKLAQEYDAEEVKTFFAENINMIWVRRTAALQDTSVIHEILVQAKSSSSSSSSAFSSAAAPAALSADTDVKMGGGNRPTARRITTIPTWPKLPMPTRLLTTPPPPPRPRNFRVRLK